MSAGTVITVVALLLTMWAAWVWSWNMHTWRPTFVTAVGSICVGLLAMAETAPVGVSLATIVWMAVMGLLLVFPDLVSNVPRYEYEFISEYVRLMKKLNDVRKAALVEPPEASIGELQRIVEAVAKLTAPIEWQHLQVRTLRELRRRLAFLKTATGNANVGRLAGDSKEWADIQDEFEMILKRQTRFSRGWPVAPNPQ